MSHEANTADSGNEYGIRVIRWRFGGKRWELPVRFAAYKAWLVQSRTQQQQQQSDNNNNNSNDDGNNNNSGVIAFETLRSMLISDRLFVNASRREVARDVDVRQTFGANEPFDAIASRLLRKGELVLDQSDRAKEHRAAANAVAAATELAGLHLLLSKFTGVEIAPDEFEAAIKPFSAAVRRTLAGVAVEDCIDNTRAVWRVAAWLARKLADKSEISHEAVLVPPLEAEIKVVGWTEKQIGETLEKLKALVELRWSGVVTLVFVATSTVTPYEPRVPGEAHPAVVQPQQQHQQHEEDQEAKKREQEAAANNDDETATSISAAAPAVLLQLPITVLIASSAFAGAQSLAAQGAGFALARYFLFRELPEKFGTAIKVSKPCDEENEPLERTKSDALYDRFVRDGLVDDPTVFAPPAAPISLTDKTAPAAVVAAAAVAANPALAEVVAAPAAAFATASAVASKAKGKRAPKSQNNSNINQQPAGKGRRRGKHNNDEDDSAEHSSASNSDGDAADDGGNKKQQQGNKYDVMTSTQLQALCKKNNLSTGGSKAAMIERLRAL